MITRSAARRIDGWFTHPGSYCVILAVAIVVVVGLDPHVGRRGHYVLGAATAAMLVLACRPLPRSERISVALVVGVATAIEILASVVWGVYVYRLDSVPLYVPPGHGLIFLGGVAVTRLAWARRHDRVVRGCAVLVLSTWTLWGLLQPVPDVLGLLSGVILLPALVFWRNGLLYAGVFAFVTLLELWGTQVGAWQWMATVPNTSVTAANPPSGVAGGYVIIEASGLACAAIAHFIWRRRPGRPLVAGPEM